MSEQRGFFWHVHHDILLEWCFNYQERVDFIRRNKETTEQETRLRLFQPVKGVLPQEVIEAGRAYDEAWRAYIEAEKAYIEAGRAYDEAWQACDEALRKNREAIEALHSEECLNCPWNGRTIFPAA